MHASSARRWVFAVLAFLAVPAVAVLIGTIRLERATARRVDALRSTADAPAARRVDPTELAALPPPVRRYFEAVLDDDRPIASVVRLEQRGSFRLGGRDGAWKPMTATQHYTVDPPGFVWDATITVAPFLPTRVVDAYEYGRGSLRASVLSILPVAAASPSPALDEAELLRYLGEAVWFPTALLPACGVEWDPIDDRSARATIHDRGTTASLVFHFGDDALVERVTGARYRQEDDTVAPWTGHFENYQWRGGVLVPVDAAVQWELPDGPLPYWRAHLTSVDSQPE